MVPLKNGRQAGTLQAKGWMVRWRCWQKCNLVVFEELYGQCGWNQAQDDTENRQDRGHVRSWST